MRQSSSDRQVGEAVEAARIAMLAAPNARARFQALVNILGAIGFDQINYGFFDPDADNHTEPEATYFSTLPQEWLNHYFESGMYLHDPHYLNVRARQMSPYLWGDTQIRALTDPKILHTSRAIESAGQRSSISVPLASSFSPSTPAGGMTLGSSMDEHDFLGSMGANAWRLMSLVHLFHQSSEGELQRTRLGIEPLSRRERDCLRYTSEGLLQSAIAHRLRISLPTVEVHLRNAKRKLKARTLPQAIARAIALAEIPPA